MRDGYPKLDKQDCDNCGHCKGKHCCGLHGMTLVRWCMNWKPKGEL